VEAPVIRLGKASTLRARVVDRAGKPVAGAYFAANTWRGHQWSLRVRIQTDAAGRITWTSAPSDAVFFGIFKNGYMRKSLLPLTASDQEHVVTLDPELVISGTVTDATTGQPVPRFRVIQGREQLEGRQGLWWSHNNGLECTGGRYSIKFDFPVKAQYVRIEAYGYEPADSRAFRADAGAQVQDFALKPAAGVSGVLLFPDGRPAAGVKVALGTKEDPIILEESLLGKRANVPTAITDPDGRFTLPKRTGPLLLVAADKAGFANASREDFENTGKLVLQPWGRIEGVVLAGRKPAARQPVSFTNRIPTDGRGIVAFNSGGQTASDEQGRFVFERVIPGFVAVSRDVMTMLPSGANNRTWCWQDAGDVEPGGTVKVIVGAKGRTVVGRVVLEGTPDDPVDWRRNEPVALQPTREARIKATRQWNTFAANLDETGRFRIEDVIPGTYELNIPVDWPLESTANGLPTRIGEGTATVTIPEGPENQPVDIGDVKARLYLKVGRLAPEFNAPRLDGGPFKMSNTRGKLVLLDFWATWCQPRRAEMPALKDIQETFGADPRFLLVGVSCDEAAEAPAKYTKENALVWTQVYGGKFLEGVAETYTIRAIPSTFLIAPDGRVLAMDLRGPALKEAVRNALNDPKLFPTAR
jgi:thiol-disulfide isomerase/thioredoxin/protocatechuate 3,4-dioxygenase beta subunit